MIKLIGLITLFCIAAFLLGVDRGENKRPKGKSINQLTDVEFRKLKSEVDVEYKQREEREPFQEFKKEDKRK